MKKLLLVLALGVVVTSCKKEDIVCTSLKVNKKQIFLNNVWNNSGFNNGIQDTIGYSDCSDTTDWVESYQGSLLVRKARKAI